MAPATTGVVRMADAETLNSAASASALLDMATLSSGRSSSVASGSGLGSLKMGVNDSYYSAMIMAQINLDDASKSQAALNTLSKTHKRNAYEAYATAIGLKQAA